MPSPPARISVCLVSGATGTDKPIFIRALVAARPAGERWAVLDNDGGDIARDAALAQLATAAISGCACCTGQVVLMAGIAQLARQSRPQRLIIAAAGAAEPAALERALGQEDLARGITVSHRLCIVGAQSAAHDLLQRQMTAADYVVAMDAATAATLRAAGIAGVIQIEEAIRLVNRP